MKFIQLALIIFSAPPLSAQEWLATSSARTALAAQQEILRAKPAADLTKDLTQYSEDEILTTMKQEVVRDYHAVLAHAPNLAITLDEYFAKDQLLNHPIVSDSLKKKVRKYILKQVTRPKQVIPK